jgi:hypothetical protein
MEDVLPPEAGLVVDGLIYRYTVEKNVADDMKVHIRNESKLTFGEYIINETDDWSQLPGTTINKFLTFGGIPRDAIGDGEIAVEGTGTVKDPDVAYTYKFDSCYMPLSDPSCPGYNDALYKWLLENGLLNGDIDINDPYYDQYVQMLLKRKTEVEEEEEEEEEQIEDEEGDEDDMESRLAVNDASMNIADAAMQNAMLQALRNVSQFDSYYTTIIPGGTYEETVVLEDTILPDNRRALNNLAQQSLHRDLVRSQYDRN